MKFYLGTHEAQWLAKADVPLFVSRRRLAKRKKLPRALGSWVLDSGGFSELSLFGGWQTGAQQYAAEVRRFRDEIGGLDWAAQQDWMCEPHLLQKTKKTVNDHQRLTVRNLLELRNLAPDLPFAPVLQGWTPDEYLRHWEMWHAYGVDLESEPIVGIGSVCRRQSTGGIVGLVRHLSKRGLRLHGFGLKTGGLRQMASYFESADSMAWSYRARRGGSAGCTTHKNCANCLRFALQWRDKILEVIRQGRRQLHLDLGAA